GPKQPLSADGTRLAALLGIPGPGVLCADGRRSVRAPAPSGPPVVQFRRHRLPFSSDPDPMTTLTPGRLLGALALLLFTLPAMAQSTPIGVWRTIDDETGEPKSHVRIYERGGKLFGDVV